MSDPFLQGRRSLPAHTAFLVDHLPLGRLTRIMDVGANPANVPDYHRLRDAGVAEVHGFEPGKEAFARLMETAKPNEHYHPHAVGAARRATFKATTNGSFASLYQPSARHIKALGHWEGALTVEQEIPVDTVALDDVPGLPRPDLLKMDTQGAELEILESGADCLSDAVAIVPELRYFQIYEGEPMMGVLDSHIRSMGFMLHKILPGAMVRLTSSRIARLRPVMVRNQMVDADFIYIRDLAYPEKMSDGQIAHLALIADSVFTSMDLVLRCLDLLMERDLFDGDLIDDYIDALPRNFQARVEPGH